MSDDTLKALAFMVALWEATFDEGLRCQCNTERELVINGKKVRAIRVADPGHECAYCFASRILERHRGLEMGVQTVGRG